MVYVSPLARSSCSPDFPWRLRAELWADDAAELDELAARIGLRRRHSYVADGRPYYQLSEARRRAALRAGATPAALPVGWESP